MDKRMKGYWIATYKQIDNLEKLKEYAEKATPIIKEFGGKPIIRGGKYHIIDGDEFIRTVIWEFPSFNKALECHNSAEYQEKWNIVKETCKRNLQIVEGFNTE